MQPLLAIPSCRGAGPALGLPLPPSQQWWWAGPQLFPAWYPWVSPTSLQLQLCLGLQKRPRLLELQETSHQHMSYTCGEGEGRGWYCCQSCELSSRFKCFHCKSLNFQSCCKVVGIFFLNSKRFYYSLHQSWKCLNSWAKSYNLMKNQREIIWVFKVC